MRYVKKINALQTSTNIISQHTTAFGNTENGCLWHLQYTDNQYSNFRQILSHFTGKERDEETGYGYFGARYMDHELMTMWLSVDPMSDKYPSLSPYNYCAWNPVKVIDPNGDSIRNAYEIYRDISNDISYFEEKIKKTTNENEINAFRNKIKELKENNNNYKKVNSLLSAYKKNNETEYNLIDNISYNGNNIDVWVKLSDMPFDDKNGAVGETKIVYELDKGKVSSIKNNNIMITLYTDAFKDGFNGVGSLANEFGDVLFGIIRPNYNYATNNIGLDYKNKPTTKFSYDYEQHIVSRGAALKPDPFSY